MSKYHNPELDDLIAKSKVAVAKMTPEEYALMMEAQKRSFVRAMTTPCEHGMLDFEDCTECRSAIVGDCDPE